MLERLYEILSPIGNEMALFLLSLVPFVELRGGVILGHALSMDPLKVLLICFIANCIPIPFVIFLARPMFKWLKKFRFFEKIITKIENKVDEKSGKVKAYKYEMLGLFLFVGVPLPGTGAYTGSLIAALFNMRVKYALPVIVLGVLAAGIIMTVASMGVFSALDFLI